MTNFLLAFSRRPVNCVIAAVDGEQAEILIQSMNEEAQLNPWLANRITYHAAKAEGPGGSLKVLKADAPSAYGQKIDLLIFEELTWWKKQDLWTALWSGKEKRPGCITVVITNAGALGSWQHNWLRDCQADPKWSVEEIPPGQHLASWMDAAEIAKMKLQLPPGIAARVVDNRWVSPSEAFGFLSEADITACIDPNLTYAVHPTRYFMGLDYGPRRDRTALCILHREGVSDLLVVDELVVWQGSPEHPVQVEAVEQWAEDRFNRYPDIVVCPDKYQMEGSIQKMQRMGRIVKPWEPRGGKGNYEMAENLRSLIVNHRLRWRPGDGLVSTRGGGVEDFRQELLGLVMAVTPYGYRFDHKAGHHDDRACAVGMAALEAVRDPSAVPWVGPNGIDGARPAADRRLWMGPDQAAHMGRARGDFRGLWGLDPRPAGSRIIGM
jgi:hypothetical protein